MESPELARQVIDFMDEGVLPTVACRVIDDNGKLRWLVEVNGERAEYDRNPNSTWLQRLTARIVQMPPVHEQLEKSTDRYCAQAGRYLCRGIAVLPAGKRGPGRVLGQTHLDVMWAAPGFPRRSLAGKVPMKLLRVENLNAAVGSSQQTGRLEAAKMVVDGCARAVCQQRARGSSVEPETILAFIARRCAIENQPPE
jgi:hypothetical protein